MNDVRLPIETIKEGNKITKICTEDVYKIINRVYESMDKAYNNSVDIMDSIHKTNCFGYEGELIVGKGISQPCLNDAFDEQIGNNIAFMKAKLNANIKKHNFLVRIFNEFDTFIENLNKDIDKVDNLIKFDLEGIRKHNPDYLPDIENKLGIF